MPRLSYISLQRVYIVRALMSILMVGVAVMMLSACGVKPARLSPPADAQETPFPRTYPDPSTDPISGNH